MRILFIGAQPDLYGASRMLLRMAAGVAARGAAVTCVVPSHGPMEERLRDAGVAVRVLADVPVLHRNAMRSPGGWVGMMRRMVRFSETLGALCEEIRPDVVHTNTSAILPVAGAVAARLKLPHVQHMREFYTGFGPLWAAYRTWLQRRTKRIVCVSAAVAAQVGGPRGKVRVIHDGFTRDDFEPATPESVAAFRRQCGLRDGAPLVGVVGRIKRGRKGQDVFLRAAALVASRFPDARFAVVGAPFRGNEYEETTLRRLAETCGISGQVVWTGEVPDTRPAFAAMDVAVTASVMPEPFGNATLEAMIQERAVVATATGGTVEQIVDGESGLLVPPGDAAAMARAIGGLLEDRHRRETLGRNARMRVMVEFTEEKMTDRLLEMYGELRAG